MLDIFSLTNKSLVLTTNVSTRYSSLHQGNKIIIIIYTESQNGRLNCIHAPSAFAGSKQEGSRPGLNRTQHFKMNKYFVEITIVVKYMCSNLLHSEFSSVDEFLHIKTLSKSV